VGEAEEEDETEVSKGRSLIPVNKRKGKKNAKET